MLTFSHGFSDVGPFNIPHRFVEIGYSKVQRFFLGGR